MQNSHFIKVVVVFVIGLLLVWDAGYTVDQGGRGVILRYGAVIGVAAPGLGFKLPILDSIK